MFDKKEHSHKRLNILTGDWVLVSPHRMKRPWQGKVESLAKDDRPSYDPACYLCPGNKRSDDSINPDYKEAYAFTNDFSALLKDTPVGEINKDDLLIAKSELGICRVICFSPDHSLTLPLMSEQAIENIIDGNDYATPDGTCIRDYIHVTDLAHAHVKSCRRLLNNYQESNYEVFNVGTGNGISVLEIIQAFEKFNGIKLNVEITGRREGDAAAVFADVSSANEKLQWKAERGVKEMVTSAWNWQQQLQ